ncbi:hypothetical protein IWQ62_006436, partial [Dispira parvispora]
NDYLRVTDTEYVLSAMVAAIGQNAAGVSLCYLSAQWLTNNSTVLTNSLEYNDKHY